MKQKGKAIERIRQTLYEQEQPLPGITVTELAGDRRVLIENHCGVTEYGTQRICIRVKFGKITVCGTKLELAKMTAEQLVIFGIIDSLLLQRGD